jgi:hypothetical protein
MDVLYKHFKTRGTVIIFTAPFQLKIETESYYSKKRLCGSVIGHYYVRFFYMVKGPAADATDAPQP